MSKSGPRPKTVSSRMLELDLTPLTKLRELGQFGSAGTQQAMKALTEGYSMEVMGDFQDRAAFNRERREHERQQWRDQKAKGILPGGGVAAPGSALKQFYEGLSNPEYMRMWREMTPKERNDFMQHLQNMEMTSRMGASGMMGMYPYMMNAQMQQGRGQTIDVSDLGKMFVTGVETALKAVPTQQQNQLDPVALFGEISKIVAPFKDQADSATKRQYEIMMEQIRQQGGGGMKEALSSIREVVDVFGGGTTSNVDLEIAKIQTNSNYQMMTLQMQHETEAARLRADEAKWNQVGGLLTGAMAAVVPVVAEGVGSLAKRQGQRSRLPRTGGDARPSSEPYAEIRCSECGQKFEVQLIDGQPPSSIPCPKCGITLERG